jgi:restriction endonuclease
LAGYSDWRVGGAGLRESRFDFGKLEVRFSRNYLVKDGQRIEKGTKTGVGRPVAADSPTCELQASLGIFITTSRFMPDARNYADRINVRLTTIDGPELATLMIEHNCVSSPSRPHSQEPRRELLWR